MATSKEYLTFILDQLSALSDITYKQMMGEYIVYYQGKIAAYVCDDRLLVKPVPSAIKMMPEVKFESPYDGAKDMLLVDNVSATTAAVRPSSVPDAAAKRRVLAPLASPQRRKVCFPKSSSAQSIQAVRSRLSR